MSTFHITTSWQALINSNDHGKGTIKSYGKIKFLSYFQCHIDNGVADIHFSMYQHVSFLNFHIVVFAENINIDGNVGWVFALQKIEEL